MARNLDYEMLNSWCYDNDPENCEQYGRLYTYEAAKKACATIGEGWRLPTTIEVKELINSLGGFRPAYTALIKGGDINFGGLLGGMRDIDGDFVAEQKNGSYWSYSEVESMDGSTFFFGEKMRMLFWAATVDKSFGASCRCVKNRPKTNPVVLDGIAYSTKQFNGLRWTTENLNYEIMDSWCYENDPGNCEEFGRLYTWEAAKKACAALGNDWRLPTIEEITQLENSLGGKEAAYNALVYGVNIDFKALSGGFRSNSKYGLLGMLSGYWCATEEDAESAWIYNFAGIQRTVNHAKYPKTTAFSCRCVKGHI